MGGRAEGLACVDPGARTPIGASGNLNEFKSFHCFQVLTVEVERVSCGVLPGLVRSWPSLQSVLVFYKFNGEGDCGDHSGRAMGTVETIQREGRMTVHYNDFGHTGKVEVGQLKSMGCC